MTRPTVWPARRAGRRRDIVLCGRMVGGQYVCTGVIAYHVLSPSSLAGWCLPPGLVEDPPGSRFYRAATRFVAERPRFRRPVQPVVHLPDRTIGGYHPWVRLDRLPVRRLCPKCRCVAEITADVLDD